MSVKKAVRGAQGPSVLLHRLGGRSVAAALILEAVLAALAGPVLHDPVLTTLLLIPVLAVAAFETSERTAVAAGGAFALSLLCTLTGGFALDAAQIYRIAVVAGGSALGVGGAELRDRAVRAHRQMQVLARVAQIADGSPHADRALARLPEVVVPAVADLCEIEATTEAIELHLDLGEAEAEADSAFPGARRLRELGMRSAIITPMQVAGRTLAVITLAVGGGRRRLSAGDLDFARTLASRAALAVENARLLAEANDARRRMEAIVGSLAEAVTIREPSGRITYANAAALRSMGFDSLEELLARTPDSIMGDYIVTDEHGRPLDMDDVPSVRLLRGETAEPLLMRTVNRAAGTEHWRLLKTAPLEDDEGRLVAAVTIIEDVTEAKRAELRMRFLARVSAALAESLDFEITLRNVAWLAVPEIADWCAVDLFDEQGERQQVAVAHRDPEKLEIAMRLREHRVPNRAQGVGLVLRTGQPVIYEEIDPELLATGADSEERRRMLLELGVRSAMILPLQAAGRTLGVMTLATAESGRRFTRDDLLFAEQIAARSAVAVENARQATRRREVATTLQRSLLPDRLPELDGWEAAAMYRPSGVGEDIVVGGDFYDFLPGADGWLVLLGDVTGKGIEAAAMTSLLRHGARFVAPRHSDPGEILAELNRVLLEQEELSLCSILCLRLLEGRVAAASGGHPAPLVLRDDGRLREIGLPGPLLGAWPGGEWVTREFAIGPDETLLMYTDGVLDTLGAEDRFGTARLRELLRRNAGASPSELLQALRNGLDEFMASAASDDTAALALRPRSERPQGR